jgi:hypothetical protein
MKRPAPLFIVLFLLGARFALFGLGDPEAGDFQEVNGLENWDHRIDLSGYQEGKYNLIIRGSDAAGNLAYEGPYNIFVDPASDLPVVRIANPAEGMRVGGSLNVVGACVDDDGVRQVQVCIDDGEPRTAEGGEFWSLRFDLEGFDDGQHSVSAWGVDINGNSGESQSVGFYLDRRSPVIRISSHASGALVSGKVTLEGLVTDRNGVSSLEVSSDGGDTYLPLKLSRDKEKQHCGFSHSIDTEALADGPQVFWFRAIDETGSVSQTAFLMFVNNEQPYLELLYPPDESEVSGRVVVSGRAYDRIGLRSLGFDLDGGEGGEVELVPGNPFWTRELDLSGRKAGALQVVFTLENLTGNRSSMKLRLKVDPDSDRPRLQLATPTEGSLHSGPPVASGFVRDEDGVQSVEYAVDGSGSESVAAGEAFRFTLDALEPGRHTLSMRAVDLHGTAGETEEVDFIVTGPPPRIEITGVEEGETPELFQPGYLIGSGQKARLSGQILFSGDTVKAEYSFGAQEHRNLALRKGGESGKRYFELAVAGGLPPGRVDLSIRAIDAFDQVAEYRSFFFAGKVESADRIIFQDARLREDGSIVFSDEVPLYGYAGSGPLRSLALDPPTELVRIRAEGALVCIEPAGAGISEPTVVRATTAGGRSVSSLPLRFVTDRQPPVLEIEQPLVGLWTADTLLLEGTASDASGIRRIEYSLDRGDTFLPVERGDGENSARFSKSVSLAALSDGPFLLLVRAVDRADNQALQSIPVYKDTVAPLPVLLAPGAQDELNGLISLVGRVEEEGRVQRIEFSDDGESFREVGEGRHFVFDLNLSAYETLPESFTLRAVDAAGNQGVLTPSLDVNREVDKPVVQIQIPAQGELIKNDFIISGMVFDDDQVAGISYRLDEGELRSLQPAPQFSIPVAIEDITDNEHRVEVIAEDSGGLKSDLAVTTFMVSTSEPESLLLGPGVEEQVRGVIGLRGESRDPNGIEEVFVSLDNGHSFQEMQGDEQWSYRLDSSLLADGTHAVLIKAVDCTGTEGLYTTTINVDNQAPQIILDTPSDGQLFTRSLKMDGRAADNIALVSLTARLTPASTGEAPDLGERRDSSEGRDSDAEQTSGEAPSPGGQNPGLTAPPGKREFALSTEGLIGGELDIASLPAGWYNLSLEAVDAAGNVSHVSRNIRIEEPAAVERIELMFPADGAEMSGFFDISGRVVSEARPKSVVVLIDGAALDTVPVNERGYFRLAAGPERIAVGTHTVQAQEQSSGEPRLRSEERRVRYLRTGPWVTISSFENGDFVSGRPLLAGEAGYLLDPVEQDGEVAKGKRGRQPEEQKVQRVEVSFDNGNTFHKADGKESWRLRLETQELANGPLRVLVVATFGNGESAIAKTQLQVDTRPPEITLLSPEEGRRFNDQLELLGTASDEAGLERIEISLREGDKRRYGVPKFIQGLYLDVHAMGATYADVGLGLSFFDDNVKLQVQAGFSPPGRFSGLVMGAKLLANIATVPFSYFFGPSWEFFSMSLALGANFSYFTMSEDRVAFTKDGLVLAAVVGQLEFARFRVPDWRLFHTYSLYSEVQLWFISSDVEAGLAGRLSFGLRIGLL